MRSDTRSDGAIVRGGRLAGMARGTSGYSSPFRRWDSNSWVRAKPRRRHDFSDELDFFPADLTPLPSSALLRARDPDALRRELTVQQLYAYLRMTVAIELFVVNRATTALYTRSAPVDIPADCARDALRIYTDEGGHAEMCETLVAEVHAATGIEPLPHEPAFAGRLRALQAACTDVPADLFAVFAAVVSETLLTPALTAIPVDPALQPTVRAVVGDHAEDERRHFAYFRRLHFRLWDQLSVGHRRTLGAVVPQIVTALTAWDTRVVVDVLGRSPAFGGRVEECAEELAARERTETTRRTSAAHTVRMFAESGAFDDDNDAPGIEAAFAAAGLRP